MSIFLKREPNSLSRRKAEMLGSPFIDQTSWHTSLSAALLNTVEELVHKIKESQIGAGVNY